MLHIFLRVVSTAVFSISAHTLYAKMIVTPVGLEETNKFRNRKNAPLKKTRSVHRIMLLSMIFAGTFFRGATADVAYIITDLGTLGGPLSSGVSINASGQVTVWSYAGGNFTEHAFLYDGVMHDLGTLGGASSLGCDVNISGQVAGVASVASGYDRAFLYDGTLHDLGTLGGLSSFGYGINDSGQVTGYSFLPGAKYYEYRAFLWTKDTGMQNLGTLGGASSIGQDINVAGSVTGGSETMSSEFHAMLYDGMMHDLGTLGGSYSYGYRIYDVGQVTGISHTAGDAESHAFLWTPATPNGSSGMMHDLGSLGGSLSFGFGINASGQVTGVSYTTEHVSMHAFLYTAGIGMVDLNGLIDPLSGWELVNAVAINDAGQITGWGIIDGRQHAFLLTQIPEPTMLTTLLLGGILLALRRLRSRMILLCLAFAVSATSRTQAAQYTVIDLGNLGLSHGYTKGFDVNGRGQVVGESHLANGALRAFLYDDGAMYDLGTLGGAGSRAHGINDRGQVAGWSYTSGDAQRHAFLWTPTTPNGHVGTMQDLGTLGGTTSLAVGLNDAGHVVGESFTANGEVHGFLYDGTMHDLGTLGGYASAISINANGEIVGNSIALDGTWHVTLYKNATLHDLGSPGGTHAYAAGINDRGHITGWWETAYGDPESHAFLRTQPGSVILGDDIGSLGGIHTAARDINSNSDIVGTALTAEGFRHAFVRTSGMMMDLNDLIDPQQLSSGPGGADEQLSWANAINDGGQIVAAGWNAYLLTPVPEPGTLALIFLAVPVLVRKLRRQNFRHCRAVLMLIPFFCAAMAIPSFGAGRLEALGDLIGGGFDSRAYGVSADGSVVVGEGVSASGIEAFRWTSGGGIVGLGKVAGGTFSRAYAVSDDGSAVVGSSDSASGIEAFRWTSGGGMIGLGDLPGGNFESAAYGVNADGSVIVGYGRAASGYFEAFRWTSGGGMVGLGHLSTGSVQSLAYSVMRVRPCFQVLDFSKR